MRTGDWVGGGNSNIVWAVSQKLYAVGNVQHRDVTSTFDLSVVTLTLVDLDLTFDLGIVTLSLKILSWLYLTKC